MNELRKKEQNLGVWVVFNGLPKHLTICIMNLVKRALHLKSRVLSVLFAVKHSFVVLGQ